MGSEIIIVGAGGHGRVCADVAEAAGFVVRGFADHNYELGEGINGHLCVANTFEDLQEHCRPGIMKLFIAITFNKLREEIFRKACSVGFEIPTLVHPSCIVSRHAKIGPGTVVMPGSIINANSVIGECCILNSGCRVDYDVNLADAVQLSPAAAVAGGVSIGQRTFIGTGASIIPNINVGANCLVGAGAAVTEDIKDDIRVAGVPARPIKT